MSKEVEWCQAGNQEDSAVVWVVEDTQSKLLLNHRLVDHPLLEALVEEGFEVGSAAVEVATSEAGSAEVVVVVVAFAVTEEVVVATAEEVVLDTRAEVASAVVKAATRTVLLQLMLPVALVEEVVTRIEEMVMAVAVEEVAAAMVVGINAVVQEATENLWEVEKEATTIETDTEAVVVADEMTITARENDTTTAMVMTTRDQSDDTEHDQVSTGPKFEIIVLLQGFSITVGWWVFAMLQTILATLSPPFYQPG